MILKRTEHFREKNKRFNLLPWNRGDNSYHIIDMLILDAYVIEDRPYKTLEFLEKREERGEELYLYIPRRQVVLVLCKKNLTIITGYFTSTAKWVSIWLNKTPKVKRKTFKQYFKTERVSIQ